MKYTVDERHNGLDIEIVEIKAKQDDLLKALQDCQLGRCTCPVCEYEKLDSIEIESTPETIRLHLQSRPGKKFDKATISKCLENTGDKVTRS